MLDPIKFHFAFYWVLNLLSISQFSDFKSNTEEYNKLLMQKSSQTN